MTHVTCRLTAKNRDHPGNPSLGNRVWATFTFTYSVRNSRQSAYSLYATLQHVPIQAVGKLDAIRQAAAAMRHFAVRTCNSWTSRMYKYQLSQKDLRDDIVL